MVELLNQLLADYANLISMTLEAHWNVRGSQFFTLHKLFEQLYEDLNGELDTLAERISILGGFALGGWQKPQAWRNCLNIPRATMPTSTC